MQIVLIPYPLDIKHGATANSTNHKCTHVMRNWGTCYSWLECFFIYYMTIFINKK